MFEIGQALLQNLRNPSTSTMILSPNRRSHMDHPFNQFRLCQSRRGVESPLELVAAEMLSVHTRRNQRCRRGD